LVLAFKGWWENTQTHRQQGDIISLFLFFQNKENMRKAGVSFQRYSRQKIQCSNHLCKLYSLISKQKIHINTQYICRIKVKNYPCNRPWRPIELWDV
jgi:hypothetical protein